MKGASQFTDRFDTKDGNSERKLRKGPRSFCQDTLRSVAHGVDRRGPSDYETLDRRDEAGLGIGSE